MDKKELIKNIIHDPGVELMVGFTLAQLRAIADEYFNEHLGYNLGKFEYNKIDYYLQYNPYNLDERTPEERSIDLKILHELGFDISNRMEFALQIVANIFGGPASDYELIYYPEVEVVPVILPAEFFFGEDISFKEVYEQRERQAAFDDVLQDMFKLSDPLEGIKVQAALNSELMKLDFRKRNNPDLISSLDYTIIAALKSILDKIAPNGMGSLQQPGGLV